MIRVSLPNYFSNLPVPSSIGGWFSLSGKARNWVVLWQNYLIFCPLHTEIGRKLVKINAENNLNPSQLSVGDWMRLIPFGATVGGLSYLSLKGLANTPVVGPYIQVINYCRYICLTFSVNFKSNISSKLDHKQVLLCWA